MLPTSFPKFDPIANPEAIVQCGTARFTVLTDRLIRMEYDPRALFEDAPSQVVWYRAQAVPPFSHDLVDGWHIIQTEKLRLRFLDGGEFRWRDLQVDLLDTGATWKYGDADHTNLGGTARTLDGANGSVPLSDGLVSRSGWSVLNDSYSLVFNETGWVHPRPRAELTKDLYFFGYGQDYLGAVQAFQMISGKPGLLPRWALGNWWSRYWAFSQDELTGLMRNFMAHEVPLSVCIIDMDWHITNTGNQSSGWTGYTWNKDLFPDPPRLIQDLHAMRLKTALNVHPADGVYPHEAAYQEMAEAIGQDPDAEKPVEFDIASPDFTKAYFKYLHHNQEDQGIDFWWLDWQQGTKTKTEGLDPLFWLNHLHYYDLGRTTQKRPFAFSRWPGLGGQRYPIGFSGDSIVSWESLEFQPTFTATASNVAYGWWSHDIGGHAEGVEEAELYLRWVQYGVFSPIFRLHSTNNPFIERLPWGYDATTFLSARKTMQHRHELVPMLYTASWRNTEEGLPPIQPLYYKWPQAEPAYHCPQAYLFCDQILAAPYTTKTDPSTNLSRQVVWLPEGDWYDWMTGKYFPGNAWYAIYGGLEHIPLFLRAGAILPLAENGTENGVRIPERLKVVTIAGAASSYTLYEDQGEDQSFRNGEYGLTQIEQNLEGNTFTLRIAGVNGNFVGLPSTRSWDVEIMGVSKPKDAVVIVGGEEKAVEATYDKARHTASLTVKNVPVGEDLTIRLTELCSSKESTNLMERVLQIIKSAAVPSLVKQIFMQKLPSLITDPSGIFEIAHYFMETQLLALFEAIFWGQATPISRDAKQAYTLMINSMYDMMRRHK